MPGIKERLAAESKEAELLLAPVVSTVSATITDDAAISMVQSVPSSVVSEPVVAEVKIDELQAQISSLKRQLEDENNPTNKSRWLTLKGICAKQIETIKTLEEKVKELETQPTVPVVTSSNVDDDVLNKMKQDYGDKVVDTIKNLAANMAQSIVDEKLKGYDTKLGTLENSAALTKEDLFFRDLELAVPGWKEINGWPESGIIQDPKFTEFAYTEVPGTDYTYNDVLISAYHKLNASGVAKIFNLFKNKTKPVEVVAAVIPQVPKGPTIDDLIDPNTSGAGGTIIKSKKKTYTQAEIAEFYDSVTKRRFTGTIAERNILDKEYQDAIMEDRVI